jgi:glycosyltransferase involved in cell wall biosynthesis
MFAVSNANKKIIENRYKREVNLLYNGVDVNLFKPNKIIREDFRKKYNLENKKVLISVGRVVGWKGFQLVIEVLKNIDAYYILIGKGEYLDKLKNLAKNLQVEKKVLFLGEIDNKFLPNYLNIGDVFVQPSIGHEAFGITLVEAMACGLPVVASKNGGIIDIVKNGENGFLFEINNKKELKENIIKVLKNRDYLSENARNYVVNYFTWEKTIQILMGEIK